MGGPGASRVVVKTHDIQLPLHEPIAARIRKLQAESPPPHASLQGEGSAAKD